MNTVGQPIAATPPWLDWSPTRAAGLPPIMTVGDPLTMTSVPPLHAALSPARAAGNPPIRTFAAPPVAGPPTCGAGVQAGHA
jgi:hypothetical protein